MSLPGDSPALSSLYDPERQISAQIDSDNNLGKEHCNKLPAEFIQQEALALPLALAGEIEAYQCPGAKVDGTKAAV
jgi:hypothetical protein